MRNKKSSMRVKRNATVSEEMERLAMNVQRGTGCTHLQGKGNLSKIIGSDRACFTLKDEGDAHLFIITPSVTGVSINGHDDISWQSHTSGEIGKVMAHYIGKHYLHPTLVKKPVGDTGAFINVVEFNLNDFEKPKEEPKQEGIELKPVEPNKYSLYDVGQALMHLLQVQDEMKAKVDELYTSWAGDKDDN